MSLGEIHPPRVPFVNDKGMIGREWYNFLSEMHRKIAPGGPLTKVDDSNVTLTLGGDPDTALLAPVTLTIGWTGTLSAARGGIGIASYTIGDILYASGATALSALAAVATGNVLISGGVGTAPAWGKVGLTTHVSGILPAANGGTNNGFTAITGPTTATKTFTLPDASDTIACLGQAQSFSAAQTISAAGSTSIAQLTFSGTTNRWISFGSTGAASPAFTTRSIGTKIVLFSTLSGAAVDSAIGIEGGNVWFSTPDASTGFKFYAATTAVVSFSGGGNIGAIGSILSSGTAGVGYSTGAGGTVTQATSKATGVTLNKTSGAITLNNAALAAATSIGFTLTNSTIAANDTLIVNIASGATANSYTIMVDAVAAGSCHFHLRNESAGSLSEAIVLNFSVFKGASS